MPVRSLRLSEELDARVEAARSGASRNKWIIEAIEARLLAEAYPDAGLEPTVKRIVGREVVETPISELKSKGMDRATGRHREEMARRTEALRRRALRNQK